MVKRYMAEPLEHLSEGPLPVFTSMLYGTSTVVSSPSMSDVLTSGRQGTTVNSGLSVTPYLTNLRPIPAVVNTAQDEKAVVDGQSACRVRLTIGANLDGLKGSSNRLSATSGVESPFFDTSCGTAAPVEPGTDAEMRQDSYCIAHVIFCKPASDVRGVIRNAQRAMAYSMLRTDSHSLEGGPMPAPTIPEDPGPRNQN